MKTLPDLRLLATFLAVLDHGSMAEAAQRLGYVPSAVSQHVAALERALGIELLARKPGRRVAPTAAGRSVGRAARALLVAAATYQDVAAGISASAIAEIRMGSFPTALSYLLPDVLVGFADDENGIRLNLVEVETPAGLSLLRNGDIDVLLAYRYLPEDPPGQEGGWSTTSLGREPLVVVSKRGLDLSMHDCADRDWIAGYPTNADNRMLHRWAHDFGFVPRVPFETEDSHSCRSFIEAGLAVGMLPAIVVQRSIEAGRLEAVRLPPDESYPTREIMTVTRDGYRSPAVTLIIERLRKALARTVAGVRP